MSRYGKAVAYGGDVTTALTPATAFCRLSTIVKPSTTPLLVDGRAEQNNFGDSAGQGRFDLWETYVATRHFDGANLLFVDHHVQHSTSGTVASATYGGWTTDTTPWTWWGP